MLIEERKKEGKNKDEKIEVGDAGIFVIRLYRSYPLYFLTQINKIFIPKCRKFSVLLHDIFKISISVMSMKLLHFM